MTTLRVEKVLTLPTTLTANTMYLVKTTTLATFDIYLTNSAGNITLSLNKADVDYNSLQNLPNLSTKANLVNGKVPTTEIQLSASDISYLSTTALPASNVTEAISYLLNKISDTPVSDAMNGGAALVTDNNGIIVEHSSVSSAEIGHLNGVTSNLQDQLNAKQGTLTLSPNSLVLTDNAGKPVSSTTITMGMLNALMGISELKTIQEQLDSKLSSIPESGGSSVAASIPIAMIPGITTEATTLEEVITVTLTQLQNVATTGETQW